jgi:L-alanine-DL-glutamate epimerase-like enolase superfamily enzyme
MRCSQVDEDAAMPASPALVRVDARWASGDDAIVVTAMRAGRTGYGAATTGEAQLGDGLEWIFSASAELVQLTDVRALWAFSRRRRATIGRLPAAWAAVELALLDLFAREKGKGIGALLGETPSDRPLPRTAAITDEVGRDLEDAVAAAAHAGIVDFALRLCGNVHRDRARLDAIRIHVPQARVRVRCQGLFRGAKHARAYLRPSLRCLWAIEDAFPLATHARQLSALSRSLERPIVITDPADVHTVSSERIRWVAELDLARAGGLLRAIELGRAARAAHRPVVLGTPTSTNPIETQAYRVLAQFAD